MAEKKLIENAGRDCNFDKKYLRLLQGQIVAYFEGEHVDFSEKIAIASEGFSEFAGQVYEGCRRIKYGQTMSYGQLAEEAGRSGAGRAVGTALAKNRLPLIIPCHRVIRSDGGMGGFSAIGGVGMKKRLLLHEKGLKK